MKKAYIPIITRGESAVVYLEDILYIFQYYRKVSIHTKQKQYVFYKKLDEIMSCFTEKNFFRCHKGCLINMEKVISMSDCIVTFEDGIQLSLGRTSYSNARRNYTQYILEEKDDPQCN